MVHTYPFLLFFLNPKLYLLAYSHSDLPMVLVKLELWLKAPHIPLHYGDGARFLSPLIRFIVKNRCDLQACLYMASESMPIDFVVMEYSEVPPFGSRISNV